MQVKSKVYFLGRFMYRLNAIFLRSAAMRYDWLWIISRGEVCILQVYDAIIEARKLVFFGSLLALTKE